MSELRGRSPPRASVDLMELYRSLAWCYDFITTGYEHKKEADFVMTVVEAHKRSEGNSLLDAGCGHGWHDYFLKKDFEIAGVDLNEPILEIARKRNPEVEYVLGDMRDFDLNEEFDVVLSFDALEHLLTYEDLEAALACLLRHLNEDGVLIFHLDRLRENFQQFRIAGSGQYTKADTQVAFLDLEYDKNPEDTVAEGCLVFLIREKGKDLDVRLLEGESGLFELAEMQRILDDMGLKTFLYSGDFSGREYSQGSPFPVFVCLR
ncbi:MAG: class I SAM-dependent methyltransferase [Thermoplasmata archaeon]